MKQRSEELRQLIAHHHLLSAEHGLSMFGQITGCAYEYFRDLGFCDKDGFPLNNELLWHISGALDEMHVENEDNANFNVAKYKIVRECMREAAKYAGLIDAITSREERDAVVEWDNRERFSKLLDSVVAAMAKDENITL